MKRILAVLIGIALMLTGASALAASGDTGTVRISLDEWIGWKSLIDANGGLTTAEGSINAKNGVRVEYVVTNNPVDSSNALISGALSGAGYTINRYAFLQDKFERAGLPVVMPYITNYSNGGDGIIARADIKSVKDLIGKKVAVPRFSEAQTLMEWLMKNSSLTNEEQSSIRDAMVYFETADEAAKAFFSGNVDAAATWEPYLTQAKTSTDAHILFDTSMSSNLILDGIVFRRDFLDGNKEFVTKLIDGALEASSMYRTEFAAIKAFPMFALMTDEDIVGMAAGANLTTWKDNAGLLSDTAVSVYRDMAEIWMSLPPDELGSTITAYPDKAETAFTDECILPLEAKYKDVTGDATSAFTDENRQLALEATDEEALLSYNIDIKFELNSIAIKGESLPTLDEFVRIAKTLNGVYVQIEGNCSIRGQGVSDEQINQLSYSRAGSVSQYFQDKGIAAERIIVVGNGDGKPIGDNATEEGRAANRRTEIYFKVIVGY